MFKVDETPTFTRQVNVKVPKGDGHEEQPFKATFKAVDEDDFEGVQLGDAEQVKALLRKMLEGMEDLADAAGGAIPYSEVIREKMLKLPYVRLALIAAYYDGMTDHRSGN
ncbi:hypothetical protein [Phaeobacter sp. HF9A]|uniref:hypothetical protein n=1 Tax=Phaeobacter sp. HF9A TaxID=2721561 RepID=UPI001431982B|nr:hypothetical protein [Phaeobacter sp. HF9A]NIZ12907.1 hypothetical protein [Phaeobacter sp. HF9A]